MDKETADSIVSCIEEMLRALIGHNTAGYEYDSARRRLIDLLSRATTEQS